jgi:hypothetical protein
MQVKETVAAIVPASRLRPAVAVNKHPVYGSPMGIIAPCLNLPVRMTMAGSVLDSCSLSNRVIRAVMKPFCGRTQNSRLIDQIAMSPLKTPELTFLCDAKKKGKLLDFRIMV